MTHELSAQEKAFIALAPITAFSWHHRHCPQLPSQGAAPAPRGTPARAGRASCGLGLQIPPGLVCVVGGEVADPSVSQTAQPGPQCWGTHRKVPKAFGWVRREPWAEARSPKLCHWRPGVGRAASAGQDAAGLAAAQNSFASVTDDFVALMEEPLGCLRPQVAFPTVPGLVNALDADTTAPCCCSGFRSIFPEGAWSPGG